MAVVFHLRAQIPTDVTRLDDGRWRAVSAGLGLYAYGASADAASHGIIEQVNALADLFESHESLAGLKDRFKQAGIDLTVQEERVPEVPAQGGGTLPLMLAFGKVLQHA